MQFPMNSILNILVVGLVLTPSCLALPAVNQALRNMIEEIRLQMPCGINGGPPLVPYRQELLPIEYEEDMIKYIWQDKHIGF